MLDPLQTGRSSKGYTPGPTVKLERAIDHLLNYYLDALPDEVPRSREIRLEDGAALQAKSSKKLPDPIDA